MAGSTSVPLVAAVSNAGGLGTLGIARTPAEQNPEDIHTIRETTKGPFGVTFSLSVAREPAIDAALNARPPVFSAAWARADQDLRALFGRAHEAGSQLMYMAGTVPEALRGKAAGADVIVAQGTEGGGHVGWMASMAVLPMIVDAVGSTPVMAAGGIADGRGLGAAPARAKLWPGARARSRRNAFIERWAGREWELRARQPEVAAALQRALETGDADNASLLIGQDAGVIHDIPPAGEPRGRIVAEAEALLKDRLPKLVRVG